MFPLFISQHEQSENSSSSNTGIVAWNFAVVFFPLICLFLLTNKKAKSIIPNCWKRLQIARYEIMLLVPLPVGNGMWDVSKPTKEKVLCMCEFSIHKRCQIDNHGDCGDRNFIYPWRRCSADCSSAKISCIILLFHPTCALHRQPLGVRSSSFLCAPSGSWLTKGCEGGFLCVMWLLVSWNLKRCGRNLITSTSKQPLEQRQPLAPMFSDWRQAENLEVEDVSGHDSVFTNLAVLLRRFTTLVWKL